METVIKQNHELIDSVQLINKLAKDGANDPAIIKAAKKCQRSSDPLQCAFDFAYNAATFEATPPNRQQLKTVSNILRTKRTNCTGYCTIIGALLYRMKIPFFYRCVGYSKDEIGHIYIISRGKVLDCTIGQRQDGTDTFLNRPPKGQYNKEVEFPVKLDYPPNMLTVLNSTRISRIRTGTHRPYINRLTQVRKQYKLDGIDPMTAQAVADKLPQIIAAGKNAINVVKDLVAQIFGDPCKRGCDLKHPWPFGSTEKRRACKAQCEAEQEAESIRAYNYALSLMDEQQRAAAQQAGFGSLDIKTLLPLAVVGGAIYYFTKN